MNISKFFNIFRFGKSEVEDSQKNQNNEMDKIFIEKIKDLRFEFSQQMIDEGYVPSINAIGELQNILLADIASTVVVVDNSYKEMRQSKGIELYKEGLSSEGSRDDRCDKTIAFIKFMVKNNYLDYDFLMRSQNLENYIDFDNMKNQIRELAAYNNPNITGAVVSSLINQSINFNFTNISKLSFKPVKENMFSMCLDFTGEFSERVKDINSETNVLKELNASRYSLPLDNILNLHGDNKETMFQSLEKTVEKGELYLINIVMDSETTLLKYILARLTSHIVENDIKSGTVTPLQIMKDTLSSETSFKELSSVVLMHHPEVLLEMSEVDSNKAIKILGEYISRSAFHTYVEKEALETYTNTLKNISLKNGESHILAKIKSDKKEVILKNEDYVELAKFLKVPQNMQEIIEMLRSDIESLRKSNINEIHAHTLKSLERNMLKSLNVYVGLVELEKEALDNVGEYIEEPVLNMLKIVREIKDDTMNSKLEKLNVNKQVATLKMR